MYTYIYEPSHNNRGIIIIIIILDTGYQISISSKDNCRISIRTMCDNLFPLKFNNFSCILRNIRADISSFHDIMKDLYLEEKNMLNYEEIWKRCCVTNAPLMIELCRSVCIHPHLCQYETEFHHSSSRIILYLCN